MKKLISILALFMLSIPCVAQSPDALAEKWTHEGQYSKAIAQRKEILSKIKDKNSDTYKVQLYKIQVAKANIAPNPKEAAQHFQKAVTVFKSMNKQPPHEKIQLYFDYSYILQGADSLNKSWDIAQRAYQLALKKESPKDSFKNEIAALLKRFAHIKWFQGDYSSAIDYFKQSLDKYTQLNGYYSMKCGNICRYIAIVYSFTPDFNSGLEYGLKAQEIYEHIQPDDKFILFKQYANNLTSFKKYGDLEKVKSLIKKIKKYYTDNKAILHNESPNFQNLDGVKTIYYYKLLQYATTIKDTVWAEKYYRMFQKTIPKTAKHFTPMERNSIVKFDLETGFLFHKHTNNYQKAKSYYLHARDFSQSIGYGFGELQAYWILTTLGVDFKQWDDVILYAEKALEHPDIDKFNRATTIRHNLAYAFYGKGYYSKAMNAISKELKAYQNAPKNLNDFVILGNCIEMGQIFSKIYNKNKNAKALEQAYQSYFLASEIFSKLYRKGEFNDQLASFQNQISEGLLSCAHQLGVHQTDALNQIEKNKSDYLWSHFLKKQTKFNSNQYPLKQKLDSLLALRHTLDKTISLVQNQPIHEDSLKIASKENYQKINAVKKAMMNSKETYYQFSNNLFQLKTIQSKLSSKHVAVRYVLADSLAFAYVIQKNNIQLIQLPTSRKLLFDKIQSYLQILQQPKSDFQPLSSELYKTLIIPLNLKNDGLVTIITDGFLGYLPFETLLGPDKKWFIEQHPISYGSSLKLWFIRQNLVVNHDNKLGVFSPKYAPLLVSTTDDSLIQGLVRSGHYALKGAQIEAKKIHHLMGGDWFSEDEATKKNFIANASKYDLLHLAMHAVINEDQPQQSGLIFSNNETLPIADLYALEIPADLVVLSACNTGFGKIKNGEGVQSLSRAFTFAGVKSIVYSLWAVPDKQTMKIMTAFYENLNNGDNKAQALQKAKIAYLQNTKNQTLKHPYYWASFVVSGDITPIHSNLSFWWYVLGGVILLLLLYFVWFQKRIRKRRSLLL